MALTLKSKAVGPWPMNTYAVICEETKTSAIIDPGADPHSILEMVKGTQVRKILLTHAHTDHVGALPEIKEATGAPVFLHPAEREKFGVKFDISLKGGDVFKIGNHRIHSIYTPGHTPGMMSFNIGNFRMIVGDTIFVGGPGKTWSAEDFLTTMRTMQNIVFQWSDETIFYPGHGPSGRIGDERSAFEAFLDKGWSKDLFGDVTWR
jgi:glyoxylase-like metal-dependent hydrolase (beta-lactamase superfamily II)